MAEVCGACGTPGATNRCSRCRRAVYCGPACQRSAWPTHRALCGTTSTPREQGEVAGGSGSAGAPPPPPEDFPSGSAKPCIADFALAATELGEGNFSTVFKATYRRSRRVYAIKRIEKGRVTRLAHRHPNIHNEIMQERQVGGALRHPHVARLHTTFQDDAALYYVYEHVQGGELWQRCMHAACPGTSAPLAPVPMPPAVAARVIHQLITALAAMHAHGVVHRDLKPENIMIAPVEGAGAAGGGACPLPDCEGCAALAPVREAGGEPLPWCLKLIDFATCKDCLAPRFNSRTEFIGTPDYMSPECLDNRVAAGGAPSDTRADLWALGAIAYQLLTGVPPFKSPSTYLTMESALEHDRDGSGLRDDPGVEGMDGLLFPVGIPHSARAFIRALLRRDRAARLGSCSDDVEPAPVDWRGPKTLGWARRVEEAPTLPSPREAPAGKLGDDSDAGSDGSAEGVSTPTPASASEIVKASRTTTAAAGRRKRAVAASGARGATGAGGGGDGSMTAAGGGVAPAPRRRNQAAEALAAIPAEATVPRSRVVVDHSSIAAHPFVATHVREALPASGGAGAGSSAIDERAAALAGCDSGAEADAVVGVPVHGSQAYQLLHLLALRRRIWSPAALAEVALPHFARCGRVHGVEWCGEAGSAVQPRRLAEHGPREWLGRWIAPAGYLSDCELTTVAVRWHAVEDPLGSTSVPAGPPDKWARDAADRIWPDRAGAGSAALNARGWRNHNAAELAAGSFVAVVAHPCVSEAAIDPAPLQRVAVALRALHRLRPCPRAVVFTGALTASFARDRAITAATVRELDALARAVAAHAPAQCSVLLAGAEGVEHAVELSSAVAAVCTEGPAMSAAVSRLRELQAFGHAAGAWLSGTRWLVAQPATLAAFTAPTPTMQTAGSASAQHAAIEEYRRALPHDARWLSQAAEMAKVSAHHTFLLLRDGTPEAQLGPGSVGTERPATPPLPLSAAGQRWIADDCNPRLAVVPSPLSAHAHGASTAPSGAAGDCVLPLPCITLHPARPARPDAGGDADEVDTNAPQPVPVLIVPPLAACCGDEGTGDAVRLHLVVSSKHGAEAMVAVVRPPAASSVLPPILIPLDPDEPLPPLTTGHT